MASMRAGAMAAANSKDDDEAGETYEVTPDQLQELQDKGSVTLESGCTLKLTDSNEAEDATDEESE